MLFLLPSKSFEALSHTVIFLFLFPFLYLYSLLYLYSCLYLYLYPADNFGDEEHYHQEIITQKLPPPQQQPTIQFAARNASVNPEGGHQQIKFGVDLSQADIHDPFEDDCGHEEEEEEEEDDDDDEVLSDDRYVGSRGGVAEDNCKRSNSEILEPLPGVESNFEEEDEDYIAI